MSFDAVLGRWRSVAMVLAIAGLAAWSLGFVGSHQAAMQSYLYAYMVWATLTLGCFAMSLLHYVTRGMWSLPLLRIFEAGGGVAALVTMAVLFVPIALSLPQLYEWADPARVRVDHILQVKAQYLNPPFFLIRTAIYFAIWIAFARVLRKSSLRQDRAGGHEEGDRRASIAAPGLVFFMLTITFAATDWVMSLEPHWYSSIYGIWFAAQMALTALAFAVLVVVLNQGREPYTNMSAPTLRKDAGTMLFAATMFWAYITLSQFLIIYAANLPELASYFVRRSHGGWNTVATIVVLGGFFVPWTALLAPRAKRVTLVLILLVALILVVRVFDMYWITMPAMREGPLKVQWTDLAALLGMGGVWFAVFAWQAGSAPLLPNHPPQIEEALEHA